MRTEVTNSVAADRTASTPPRASTRRVRTNIALLLGSTLFTLVCLEGVFRIVDFGPDALALYRPNPSGEGSFRLRPDLDLETRFGDASVRITTNGRGMRWRNVASTPVSNRSRVAFVGDSFTFGLWADGVEHGFVGVFESLVDSDRFEVMNFGVPGFGLGDVRLQLVDEVLPLAPDYVFLTLYNGNDFLDTYLGVDRYRVTRTGLLELDLANLRDKIPPEHRPQDQTTPAPLWRKSRLLTTVARALRGSLGPGSAGLLDADELRRGDSYESDAFWSKTTYPEFAQRARDVSLELLEDIRVLVERSGAQLVLATVPSMEQVHREDLFEDGYDVGLPQRYVAEFAEDRRLPYVDLRLALVDAAGRSDGPLYHLSDGHFNNDGHAVAGTELARLFERWLAGAAQ